MGLIYSCDGFRASQHELKPSSATTGRTYQENNTSTPDFAYHFRRRQSVHNFAPFLKPSPAPNG